MMTQNIYDEETFFERYGRLPRSIGAWTPRSGRSPAPERESPLFLLIAPG